MAKEIRLPKFGKTTEKGTIVDCPLKVGDQIKIGDRIFEIEIDKATVDIESTAGGFVKHVFVKVGQSLPAGAPLLILGGKNEKVSDSFIEELKQQVVFEIDSTEKPIAGKECGSEIKLGATIGVGRFQKITAQKMLQSKRQIPTFYLSIKADVTDIVEIQVELNKKSDVEISYNDFIVRAVAIALEKFSIMRGQLIDDTIQLAKNINIGLAVSVDDSLVAPVIKNANKKDIMQIAQDREALIQRARDNKLKITDLEGGCITISNLGSFGIESFTPIIIPGQCSILGVGSIVEMYVQGHDDTVRKLMNMTLSVDHRITNGAYAAKFLDFLCKQLTDTSDFE